MGWWFGARQAGRLAALEKDLAAARQENATIRALLDASEKQIKALTAQPSIAVEFAPAGNLANRMIQYMVALSVADKVVGAELSGVDFPDWNIALPTLPSDTRPILRFDGQQVDVNGVAARLSSGSYGRAVFSGWGQHLSNFLARDRYQQLFTAAPEIGTVLRPDELLISIWGGEILRAPHPSYVLIPVLFYIKIVAETGLTPVFVGQLTPGAYLDELKAAFPSARYIDSQGAIADFQTIRKARNIVLSVSTFSWLAAWLSEAEQVIMPLSGLFNPMQSSDVDLAPVNDARYRFFLFPVNYAVPIERYKHVHAAMDERWQEVSGQQLCQYRERRPLHPRLLDEYLACFDEAFYLRRYGDVLDHVNGGVFSNGADHYCRAGFDENREIMDLDSWHYSTAYPDAAVAVAQGVYLDFQHHYVSVGHIQEYCRTPTGQSE